MVVRNKHDDKSQKTFQKQTQKLNALSFFQKHCEHGTKLRSLIAATGTPPDESGRSSETKIREMIVQMHGNGAV